MLIASASIQFAFQPRQVDEIVLVNGGMLSYVAIEDPIERCCEEGFSDKDIIIDVLLYYESPWVMDKWDIEELK